MVCIKLGRLFGMRPLRTQSIEANRNQMEKDQNPFSIGKCNSYYHKFIMKKLAYHKLTKAFRKEPKLSNEKSEPQDIKETNNHTNEHAVIVEEFREKNEEKTVTTQSIEENDELVVRHLSNIEDLLKEAKEDNDQEKLLEDEELKYKYAALVMNRFFFFGAIVYFIIAFCSAVLSIPNFYKFQ